MNAFKQSLTDVRPPVHEAAPATVIELRSAGPQKRDLIAGLEKGLAVIAAFDQERPRLTMSEVAALCGLTRAAARRYLITLEHLGFVSSERKMYSLTPKVLRLGQSYMHSARLRIEVARTRAQGYAAVDQELELGLRTIAVPLRNYRGDVLAAMNVSVHAARVSMDQLIDDCLPALLHAQSSLRNLL